MFCKAETLKKKKGQNINSKADEEKGQNFCSLNRIKEKEQTYAKNVKSEEKGQKKALYKVQSQTKQKS